MRNAEHDRPVYRRLVDGELLQLLPGFSLGPEHVVKGRKRLIEERVPGRQVRCLAVVRAPIEGRFIEQGPGPREDRRVEPLKVNVVIDVAKCELFRIDVAHIRADRLAVNQPAVALLDRIERRLQPSQKGPEADARAIEMALVLEWNIVAAAGRGAADEINLHHRQSLPAQEHAIETTEYSIGIEGLAAAHHAQIPI